jgi:hypothetical protein
MPAKHPRVLVVEGSQDKYALAELFERGGIDWPRQPPVFIDHGDGYDEALDMFTTYLKERDMLSVGLLLDADGDAAARWQAVEGRLKKYDSTLGVPKEKDAGVVLKPSGGPRLGIWLMPDNLSSGMLETFLADLRPPNDALNALASASVERAKELGARFKETHRDKAVLHTWLAWEDEPGKSLGHAIKHGCLSQEPPGFVALMDWFCDTFSFRRPFDIRVDGQVVRARPFGDDGWRVCLDRTDFEFCGGEQAIRDAVARKFGSSADD